MSTPVAGSVVSITPATSPSVISFTLAPALRILAINCSWRGRSITSAVMVARPGSLLRLPWH